MYVYAVLCAPTGAELFVAVRAASPHKPEADLFFNGEKQNLSDSESDGGTRGRAMGRRWAYPGAGSPARPAAALRAQRAAAVLSLGKVRPAFCVHLPRSCSVKADVTLLITL